jgi:hypothetical protein
MQSMRRAETKTAAIRSLTVQRMEIAMKNTRKFAMAAAAALALGSAAALAHPYGYGPGQGMGPGMGWGPGHGMGPGMGWGPGHGMGPGMGRGPGFGPGFAGTAGFEGHLAALKTDLKITPAQEKAWEAYANELKQQAQSMQEWHAAMFANPQATALERSELRTKMIKQREQQAEKTAAAFKDLYAALTPDQKAVADRRFGGGMASGYGPGARRFR